jgi:uncharacterized protein YraI
MAVPNYPSTPRRNRWQEDKGVGRLIGLIAIPVLLIAALLLPPVSVVQRVLDLSTAPITTAGGVISDPDGTQVTFLPGTVTQAFRAKLSSTPRVAFLEGSAGKDLLAAAKAIPPYLIAKSPFYQLAVRGSATTPSDWLIPIPNDSEPYQTLDVYTWDTTAQAWQWLPHSIISEDDQLESKVGFTPGSMLIVQTNPQPATISADLPLASALPPEGQGALAQVHPTGLMLGDNGTLTGSIDPAFDKAGAAYAVVPVIRNYDGPTVRTDLLANMLVDTAQRDAHIAAIADLVLGNSYAGVDIDYRGLDPSVRAEFNQFVKELADKLHAENKTLAVRVEAPTQVADDRWDTGAYDWQALGLLADVVKVPAPVDPRAYVKGGQLEALLNFAVGQVNRYKLEIVLSGRSVEQAGNYLLLTSYNDALQPLMGRIQADPSIVEPGQPLNLALVSTHANSGLVYDPNLGAYVYRYQDDQGLARTVWLENAASLSHKLELINQFGIKGFMVENLPADGLDADLWTMMRDYQQGQAKPIDSNFTVEWTVTGADGQVQSQVRPLSDAKVSLAAPAVPGALQVKASIVDRGQVLREETASGILVATYTPTAQPTAAATPTPAATATPSVAQITASDGLVNVRSGPATDYPKIGEVQQGQSFKITGQNDAGDWLQIDFSGKSGWVSKDLVSVGGSIAGIAVAKAEPLPTAAPVAAAPAPAAAAPAPVKSYPVTSGGFGYGMQVPNWGLDGAVQQVKGAGFGWIKLQIPWKDLEGSQGNIDWGTMDAMVNTISGGGMHLLISIPKAPAWARPSGTDMSVEGPPADPNTYGRFVGQLAGRYCGKVNAIEVWNEQNLWYEWGHQNLSAADYVRLLSAAYGAIKAACPSTTVVSGALTPTGAPAPLAVDDFTYLEQMYQAGLKNVSDAIGAHPSGFNVSPDVGGGQAACDFIRSQGSTYQGPCNSPHHSWSFRATMEGYHNIMCKYGDCNKRIWPTEFGWASGWMGKSGYEYANDNTQQEEADWTVRAYQLMRSWGFVGPAFLWNLGYTDADGGQWNISGRPAYASLASMPK